MDSNKLQGLLDEFEHACRGGDYEISVSLYTDIIKAIQVLEKERWKTAKNLFKCRKKLKEIKQVVNE